MIFGVGIDLIEVERVAEKISKKSGFRELVFSSAEIDYCESKTNKFEHYAARFAAKEAFSKAMGTGFRYPVTLQCISVVQNKLGKPGLAFHPQLEALVKSVGIVGHHLTISDEKSLACACVVLEGRSDGTS